MNSKKLLKLFEFFDKKNEKHTFRSSVSHLSTNPIIKKMCIYIDNKKKKFSFKDLFS